MSPTTTLLWKVDQKVMLLLYLLAYAGSCFTSDACPLREKRLLDKKCLNIFRRIGEGEKNWTGLCLRNQDYHFGLMI